MNNKLDFLNDPNFKPFEFPVIDPKELEGLSPREKVKKQLEHIGMCYVKNRHEDSGGKVKFDDTMIDLILQLQNNG